MEEGTGAGGTVPAKAQRLGNSEQGRAWRGDGATVNAVEDEEQGYRLAACVFWEEDGRAQGNATGSICIKEIPRCSGLDPATAFA